MTPPIIPTERVRADQIREGDRIWHECAFRGFDSLERTAVSVILRDEAGDCLLDVLIGDLVLRQAAPASSQVVNIARCPEHGLHGCRTECFVCAGPVEQVPMVPLAAPASQGHEGELERAWRNGWGSALNFLRPKDSVEARKIISDLVLKRVDLISDLTNNAVEEGRKIGFASIPGDPLASQENTGGGFVSDKRIAPEVKRYVCENCKHSTVL